MGGSMDRILVLPPMTTTQREAQNMFSQVDVSTSKCFLESDRQRLLGIVEQGFGNFHQFNNIIRHVFNDRISLEHSTSSFSTNYFIQI